MGHQQVGRLVGDAFTAALSGDNGRAAEILDLLAQDSSTARMFGVCGAIATPAAEALEVLFCGRVPDRAKGQHWYVMHLRPGLVRIRREVEERSPHLFSQRFITAHLNEDRETQEALYLAALSVPGDHLARCVAQLFADVVGLCALSGRHIERRGR